MESEPLLAIRKLAVTFPSRDSEASRVWAVRDASLTVHSGQRVAIVGESGSGKTVTAMSVLRLLPEPAAKYERGEISVRGKSGEGMDVLQLPLREAARVRGRTAAMIFQEPITSLNPVLTIGEQVAEPFRVHRGLSKRDALDAGVALLRSVGIADAHARLDAYPHEFSGGMRQRVLIAAALACKPTLLIADEPTTALDASVRDAVLNVIEHACEERGMGLVLVTHDLELVRGRAAVVCVMHAGRVVEYGRVRDVLGTPFHPYTSALRACVPTVGARRIVLPTVRNLAHDHAELARWGDRVAPGVVPWWPGSSVPPACDAGAEPQLREVAPQRWVCIWSTPASERFPASAPDIAQTA